MAYASFRCLVDAPYLKVWQSVSAIAAPQGRGQPIRQQLKIDSFNLQETVSLDPQKGEVTLKLEGGQALKGERRFAVREDTSTSRLMIECSLNWHAQDQDVDRRLHSILDQLVRDLVLEMKRVSES
ncbi:MAG TPA: hypothetical protein VE954_30355 [Oligoflexus sp.]|uniref:hypothetical protein n=1 Tax=Oligoflexus sp. TaxID=1971216 RepID=UPI002D583384|nr:hypothetical protein [Oligoflexus sp.]HYX37426.1 hypothetical protein [Oligoflexus sp.]